MNRILTLATLCLVLAVRPAAAEQPLVFPPIGDRYDAPTEDCKAAIKALSKLHARTEVGINYVDYEKTVGEAYPDVKVFLDSQEAKTMPEVSLLLTNATECFVKVKSLWNTSISSDSPSAKYDASVLILTARPALWEIAKANLLGAKALLEGPANERETTQKMVAESHETLTVANGLVIAEQQLARLERETRAKESGVPVPEPVADEAKKDLEALLFADGDFDGSVTAGGLKIRLPPVFSKVPPASQEGEVPLLREGKTCGAITAFVYESPKTARLALDAITGGYGEERQRLKGLGDAAVGVVIPQISAASLAFRRGPIVVAVRSPLNNLPDSAEALKKLDDRIAASLPANEAVAEEEPATLEDVLFQDGDFGETVTATSFTEELPMMFSGVPAAEQQGAVPLNDLGKRAGAITCFVYGSEEEAKAAFLVIAKGIGSQGTKVPGVGSAAYASRAPSGKTQDLVFRRGETVVHIRAPSKNLAAITKAAKVVDGRVRKMPKPEVAGR